MNYQKGKIDVIAAQDSEKSISFALKNLSFKERFSFLSSSLDKLVELSKLAKYFQIQYEKPLCWDWWGFGFIYWLTKGISLRLLHFIWQITEKQLPPKEAFYSNLTKSHIEDNECERAQRIREHFGLKKLGQYHNVYLRTDVLLLTDVFEHFRDLWLEYYSLDPAHYSTLPNFAWDAMLLKTGVEIDRPLNWPRDVWDDWEGTSGRDVSSQLQGSQNQQQVYGGKIMMQKDHPSSSTI